MSKRFGKGRIFARRDVINKKTGKVERKLVEITRPRNAIHHTVLPDTIDEIQHPSNGERVTSRKRYNQILKEHGHEVVDKSFFESNINNPKMVGMSDDDYMRDAAIAYEQVNSGNAPICEREREMLREIDRRNRNK